LEVFAADLISTAYHRAAGALRMLADSSTAITYRRAAVALAVFTDDPVSTRFDSI